MLCHSTRAKTFYFCTFNMGRNCKMEKKKKKRSIKSNLLTSSFHPVSSPLRGGFCGRGRSRMRMRQKGGWEGRFVLCEMKQNNLWGLGFPSNLKRSSGKGRKSTQMMNQTPEGCLKCPGMSRFRVDGAPTTPHRSLGEVDMDLLNTQPALA